MFDFRSRMTSCCNDEGAVGLPVLDDIKIAVEISILSNVEKEILLSVISVLFNQI